MVKHGALVVEDLHRTYKTAEGSVRAVRGVTSSVKPGEFYTLLRSFGVWEDDGLALYRRP